MVPLLTRSPSVGSKMVEMLKPSCSLGVGARKPLLTFARTKPKRPESSLFIVLPKSSKCSMRTAVPSVQSSSRPPRRPRRQVDGHANLTCRIGS